MPEILQLTFAPAIAALAVLVTQLVIRLGQRDTAKIQDKANHMAERTQNAKELEAIADRWEKDYWSERKLREGTEEKLKTCESLKSKEFMDAISKVFPEQNNQGDTT